MNNKTFRCNKCLREKKMVLFAYSEKSKQGLRHVCTHCAEMIDNANKIREVKNEQRTINN